MYYTHVNKWCEYLTDWSTPLTAGVCINSYVSLWKINHIISLLRQLSYSVKHVLGDFLELTPVSDDLTGSVLQSTDDCTAPEAVITE